jgi:hypothetical protein
MPDLPDDAFDGITAQDLGAESENADEICERSDMTRRSCDHCREAGLYVPPPVSENLPKYKITIHDTESLAVTMEYPDGSIWIGPDEAFRRGHLGHGRYNY